MREIGEMAISTGWESYVAYGRHMNISSSKLIKIGNKWGIYIHGILSRLFDNHGLASKRATKKLITKIKEIKPDIIHLHNIHGYYINYQILFDYLSTINIPIVWTLHDCWSFTGHCAHFVTVKCEKWKSGCYDCPLLKTDPKSLFFDRSKRNFEKKRKYFGQKTNPHIVVPSYWLMGIVKQSFLKNKHIEVINNGVDLDKFTSLPHTKQIVKDGKHIVLGVATVWSESKGLSDYIRLSEKLREDIEIVLIGLDPKQISMLPSKIIGLPKTKSQQELIEWYNTADIVLSLSYAETFGLTIAEGMACGKPAIVYDNTALPELVTPLTGMVVKTGDVNAIANAIHELIDHPLLPSDCRQRAEGFYNINKKYDEYFKLYNQLLNSHE